MDGWTFQRADLHHALSLVAPAISESTVLPVLRNILVEFDGGRACVRSNNLASTIVADLPVLGTGTTGICIPGKALIHVIANWPDLPMRVTVDDKTRRATLSIDAEKWHDTTILHGVDPEQFPAPWVAETPAFLANADSLLRLVDWAKIAVQSGHSGATSTHHMLLELGPEGLIGVGTDGIRFHIGIEPGAPTNEGTGQWKIPYSQLSDLQSVLRSWGEMLVEATADKNLLCLRHGGNAILLQCGEFNYFQWRVMLTNRQATPEQIIRTDRAGLQRAIKAMNVMARQGRLDKISVAGIYLDFSGLALQVRAEAAEVGSASVLLDMDEGMAGRAPVFINSAYLEECVSHVRGDQIELHVPMVPHGDERNCLVITAPDSTYQAYIMPLTPVDNSKQTRVE